jgi:MSHA pilin protein MshA
MRCSNVKTAGNNSGFTLIELVVVIVLLSILGAAALPKFIDMQRDSRIAVLKGARASVSSATLLAYSAAIARNQGPTVPLDMGGVLITMNNFYPTANSNGIFTAAGLSLGTYDTSPGTGAHPPGSITLLIRVAKAPSPLGCSFF